MERITKIPFEYSNDFGGVSITVNPSRKGYVICSFDSNDTQLDKIEVVSKASALTWFNHLANRLESLYQIK